MTKRPLTATQLASLYGMTARYWTRMAAEGKIPGAWQPSGPSGKWLFDSDTIRRWRQSNLREIRAWPGFTKEAQRIGDVPSAKEKNLDAPSAPRIEALLKSVCSNG